MDKQIAAVLGITPNTLRTYWTRIRGKLGEASRGALVALHATSEASASALNPIEGASWHVDVARNVLVFYGDRSLFPWGEMNLDKAIDLYHADDREKVRALLRATIERDIPPFTFAARVNTPRGIEMASAYVESVHDAEGRTTRIVGRHVPLLDLSISNFGVGSYRRNLRTGEVSADEGFRKIFRIEGDVVDILAAIYARLCPEFHETVRELVASMLAGKEKSRLYTVRLCPNDGTDGWVSVQARIEGDGEGSAFVTATILAYH